MTRAIAMGLAACVWVACDPPVGGPPDDHDGGGARVRDASAARTADGGVAPGADGGPASGTDAGARDASAPPQPGAWRVVGYFTAWGVYGRDFHVDDLPADRLTHVNYAFANLSEAGECVLGDPYADTERTYDGDRWDDPLRGSFRRLALLKERHPHLRTLISIGGWTWSARFSDAALTDASRRRFAESCTEFMVRYGFDGIDVDWEYPVGGGLETNVTRPEDRRNYTLLLEEVRRALDARGAADGRHYLLTIAAPAGPTTLQNLELAELGRVLDWINVMTYDFNGAWGTHTGFNAPMRRYPGDPSPEGFDVDSAVRAYLAGGVPPERLVLGVPFYGRTFAGAAGADGLGQPFRGPADGTWERGVVDWHDVRANYLPRMTRHWHAQARVPWLHDPSTGTFVSYDDAESLRIKRDYARELGLGGVMIWEMSSDDRDGTLLAAVQ
ncbi:MAG: glycoside hydrolase family 18 protein [Sandaracinaceae bacterium]|nr:glycoside hydrolase family 18 protein [Sandaracinaceae bacterium]